MGGFFVRIFADRWKPSKVESESTPTGDAGITHLLDIPPRSLSRKRLFFHFICNIISSLLEYFC